MKEILDQKENQKFQQYLYTRGYLITNEKELKLDQYPFYKNWSMVSLFNFQIYVHLKQKCVVYNNGDKYFFIIGHCYDPFSGEKDEYAILKNLAEHCQKDSYFAYLNQLSGNFITGYEEKNGALRFTCDATGMLAAFYGRIESYFYISSYSHLIGDICDLQFDPYIKKLLGYRFYHLFGKMLPGDMSAYKNIQHIIPNFQITYKNGQVSKKRFWPTEEIKTEISQSEYEEKIRLSAEILHSSLRLISEKWPGKAAISLTGGCDSKTTLACANGLYDSFDYFSYISSEAERIDAEAAEKICKGIGLKHKTYRISDEDKDFKDIEIWRDILRRNCGEIGENNLNDVRKRVFFVNHHDFDVEVKSWVSEIVRAYYNKRFVKEKFPKYPTPRYLTAMYKVFFWQRGLVRETDKRFRRYLKEYHTKEIFDMVNWTDLIFWEYRVSSWNGLVISNEHSLSFDIAIPYNNRILLQTLLGTPLEKRMNDQCHKDIQRLMNRKIAETGISVTNMKHTQKRAQLEKLYLSVQTKIPF